MPTAREYLVIRALTNPREWNDVQRTMMQHARNVHLRSALVLVILLSLLGVVGLQFWRERQAKDMVETLVRAHISEVPKAIHHLSGYRRWADPRLRGILNGKPEPGLTREEAERRKLHASLALLPVDPGQLGSLCDHLLKLDDNDIDAFPTLCAACRPSRRSRESALEGARGPVEDFPGTISSGPGPGRIHQARRGRSGHGLAVGKIVGIRRR